MSAVDHRSRLLHLIPLLALAIGLGLSWSARDAAETHGRETRQAEFDFRVDEIVRNVHHRLESYEQVLEGVVGLFAASHSVSRAEFAAYHLTLRLGSKYPGIQGVGFALKIEPADLDRHQAAIRAEGFPDYALRPPGRRPLHSSIVFLEPFDWRNQRAFGYDMFSEPVRQVAMMRARDQARTSISGRVRLLQETEQDVQPGFLMYLPVYRDPAAATTVAARRDGLVGWVYAPFRSRDLMTGILGEHFGEDRAGLDLEIYDGESEDPGALLFDSTERQPDAADALVTSRRIDLFGHRWTLRVRSLPAFDAGRDSGRPLLITLAGGAGSVMLALVLWLLLNARARALELARAMTAELRRSETHFEALFENMSSGVIVFRAIDDGADFVVTACNRAAERMDGLDRAEIVGRRARELFPQTAASGELEILRQVWRSGEALAQANRYIRESAFSGWRDRHLYRLADGSVVVLFNDVSIRRQAEIEQDKLNRALRLLSDCNTTLVRADDEYRLLSEICRLCVERGGYLMAWVGYAEHDAARTVRAVAQCGDEHDYLHRAAITWADEARGRGPTGTAIRSASTQVNQDVLHNPRLAPWRAAAMECGYRSSIALPLRAGDTAFGALTIYAREAEAFNPDEIVLLEEMADDLAYGIGVLRTRAAHQAAQERVDFLAHFDPLTHLPNRLLLRDRFEQAARSCRIDGRKLAMFYLDVDNFTQINDGLGHAVGDRVLVAAVARLQRCLPPAATISHLSGDEFVALLGDLDDVGAVAGIAAAIGSAFVEPLDIDGQPLNVSFSVGVSLFPDDGEDFDTLLKGADTAVRSAKDAGRNTCRFYTATMNADAAERVRLSGGLPKALRDGEFVLHYQPQIEIGSGRIVGAEALIRWQHPVDGLVPPGKFIPLAEQSGKIVEIGAWALRQACTQAMQWRTAGLPPLVVAVNLSALQFKRGDIVQQVAAVLAETGLPPAQLELELTESILLQDVAAMLGTVRQLEAIGVKLSIDDFGTGYSSLSYLKHLAVDKLKIDQSFVRDMLGHQDGATIVRAIIQLGHSLQLQVIAEGVETAAQLAFLGGSGCDEAQGYLISRPVAAAAFAQLLTAHTGGWRAAAAD